MKSSTVCVGNRVLSREVGLSVSYQIMNSFSEFVLQINADQSYATGSMHKFSQIDHGMACADDTAELPRR